jgi:hypothetical protein
MESYLFPYLSFQARFLDTLAFTFYQSLTFLWYKSHQGLKIHGENK